MSIFVRPLLATFLTERDFDFGAIGTGPFSTNLIHNPFHILSLLQQFGICKGKELGDMSERNTRKRSCTAYVVCDKYSIRTVYVRTCLKL